MILDLEENEVLVLISALNSMLSSGVRDERGDSLTPAAIAVGVASKLRASLQPRTSQSKLPDSES